MIPKIVKAWDENKKELEDWFANNKMNYDYIIIFKKVVELVINPSLESYEKLDLDRLTVIDDGDYQGTQIFIIPEKGYQPCFTDYYYANNYYGSCSGCDALESIRSYDDDKLPDKQQVKDLMHLALGLVQSMKKFEEVER